MTLHHPGGGTRKGFVMQELPRGGGDVGRQKAQSRAHGLRKEPGRLLPGHQVKPQANVCARRELSRGSWN